MIRIYADEDFYYAVVVELRKLGYDITTVIEENRRRSPDPVVLNDAIQMGHAVLTCNRRHYHRLHRRVRPHCGIITCTRDHDLFALANRIHQALAGLPSLDNQLIRITRPPPP
jgi:hypothetical protein